MFASAHVIGPMAILQLLTELTKKGFVKVHPRLGLDRVNLMHGR